MNDRLRGRLHISCHAQRRVANLQLGPQHVYQRTSPTEIRSFAELYQFLEPGQLLEGRAGKRFQPYWDKASAQSFG